MPRPKRPEVPDFSRRHQSVSEGLGGAELDRRAVIIGLLALGGCGRVRNSRFNPFNWFGGSRPEAVTTPVARTDPALTDERPLVGAILEMRIERASGGAIIRAVGLNGRQGFFGAELVPLNDEFPVGGQLTYFFRVEAPAEPTPIGPPTTRRMTVGRFVSNAQLAGVRSIAVRSANGQRVARR